MSGEKDIWAISPSKLKEVIKAVYKGSKISLLIKGAIGIGKSTLIREVAEEIANEMKLKFIDLSTITDLEAIEMLGNLDDKFLFWSVPLPNIDAVDFLGKLCEENGFVVWKPPIKIALFQKAKNGIIFLDELNMVSDQTVRHLAQRLLLDKELGNVRNPNLMVISACNRASDTMHVEELGSRAKNRVCILEMTPYPIKEFAKFMQKKYGDAFEKKILGFILAYPMYSQTLDEAEDILENFATRRSWEFLGRLLYDCRDLDVARQLARGCLGKDIAIKFVSFLEIKPIPPKDLIQKPELLETVKPEVAIYSVITLADSINKEIISLESAKKLIDYLVKNNRSLLMMLWIALERKYTQEIIRDLTFDEALWKEIEKMVEFFT